MARRGATAARRWRQRLLTVPGLVATTAITGLVSWGVTELIQGARHTISPRRPLAVAVETNPAHIGAFSDQPIAAVLPPGGGTGTPGAGCDGFRRWVRQNDGIDAGATKLQLIVQGTADEAVSLRGLRATVVGRLPSLKGIPIVCPSAAEAQVRAIRIDLDRVPPRVVYAAGAPFNFTLANGETETFNVLASASKARYRWLLELDVVAGGRKLTERIDDGGRPFDTTPAPAGPSWTWDFRDTWTARSGPAGRFRSREPPRGQRSSRRAPRRTGGQGAGRSLRTPPLPGTLRGSLVTAAAINGKGVLALGTSVGSVDVVTGGKALRLTVAHGRTITALALSRDGTTVAGLVGLDTGVSLWVWRRCVGLRQGLLPEAAETVALSAAGDLVAASGFDATVYDVGTGAHATFRQPAARGGSDQYSALALASASRLVAASIRRVDVWDLTSERLLHAFRCDCGADGVSLSHDGRLAVFGTDDAHVLVWNVTTERLLLDRTLSTVRGDHAYGARPGPTERSSPRAPRAGPSCSSTVAPERR